jgi:hypothetical protein
MIEANVKVLTTDRYLLRIFCIGFTRRNEKTQKKTCYAKGSQVCLLLLQLIFLDFMLVTKTVTNSIYCLFPLFTKFFYNLIGARYPQENGQCDYC